MTPEQLRARERLLLQEARFGALDALRSFFRDLGCHDAAAEMPTHLEDELMNRPWGEFI